MHCPVEIATNNVRADKCERFVTTDPHFSCIRDKLESRCMHARIRTPSELVSELP